MVLKDVQVSPKLAFSVKEVARETTLSQAFIRKEIRDGHLKSARVGRRVLVLTEDLQKYLKGEINEQHDK